MIAKTVLLRVDVVGVPRAEGLGNIAVVLAALVLIADQQANRRPRRAALEDAGEDLDLIRLAPLRHVPGGSRPTAVELALNVGFRNRQPGRAAINDAADRRTV